MVTVDSRCLSSRRWLRFSLRAFFVFITFVAIVAAWIGSQISRRQQEKSSIAELTRKNPGGSTTIVMESRLDRLPSANLTPLSPPPQFQPTTFWKKLRNLDMFRRVAMFSSFPAGNTFDYRDDGEGSMRIVRKYKHGLTDADIHLLGKLPDLRSLWLEANGITDRGLIQLNSLTQLEILWLPLTAVTDESMTVLASFSNLRDLDLSGTYVTDASVESLSKCQRLTHLKLNNTNITPAGIAAVQQSLPNCQIEY